MQFFLFNFSISCNLKAHQFNSIILFPINRSSVPECTSLPSCVNERLFFCFFLLFTPVIDRQNGNMVRTKLIDYIYIMWNFSPKRLENFVLFRLHQSFPGDVEYSEANLQIRNKDKRSRLSEMDETYKSLARNTFQAKFFKSAMNSIKSEAYCKWFIRDCNNKPKLLNSTVTDASSLFYCKHAACKITAGKRR